MQEAMRTYLELAMGLTETSRKRVRKVVKDVVKEAVGRSGATAEQVKALTGDLMAANSANREALAKLVRFEVDRALGMVGLATAEEVGELTQQVRDLKEQLREAQASVAVDGSRSTSTVAKATPRRPRSTTVARAVPAKVAAKKAAAPARERAGRASAPAKRTAAAKKTTTATRSTTAKATTGTTVKATTRTPAKKTVGKKAGSA
jgi:polyhydroxyalkanoate synthesis regulator phasin